MKSQNETVNTLHETYCQAMALEFELTQADERRWLQGVVAGLDADMLRLVIFDRRKRITAGVRNKECLLVRNLVGSDEAVADTMNEAAVIRAQMRVKVMPKGKADVLTATGRSAEAETNRVVTPAEIEAIKVLRKAVG